MRNLPQVKETLGFKKQICRLKSGDREGQFFLTIGYKDYSDEAEYGFYRESYGELESPQYPWLITATNGESFTTKPVKLFQLNASGGNITKIIEFEIIHRPNASDCDVYMHYRTIENKIHTDIFYFDLNHHSTHNNSLYDKDFNFGGHPIGSTIPIYLGSSPNPPSWL